jgi:class 3 adenylate cyclase
MAPELLRAEGGNSAASDVYSFGIILYEVYSRRDPYENEDNITDILRLVCDKSAQKRPPAPTTMPEKVKALMADCVEDEPDKRPTFEELDKRLQRIDCEGADPTQTTTKKAGISLFDIFPRHIAEALRDGRTVEAAHKDCVTIFFSDIAGFTDLSSSLSPRQVADLLDRLYTKFDALSQKYDIFKVETIGDAYMAVTNLEKDQHEDHAKRIAEFAIDAVLAANETLIDPLDAERGYVNIRCGFHSGSVVADVVGTRSPRYCLFGDSVNTASRMESNSKVNRILCSKASYELLKVQCPTIPVVCRGRIPIKGKGKVSNCSSLILLIDDLALNLIHVPRPW